MTKKSPTVEVVLVLDFWNWTAFGFFIRSGLVGFQDTHILLLALEIQGWDRSDQKAVKQIRKWWFWLVYKLSKEVNDVMLDSHMRLNLAQQRHRNSSWLQNCCCTVGSTSNSGRWQQNSGFFSVYCFSLLDVWGFSAWIRHLIFSSSAPKNFFRTYILYT